MQDQAKHGAYVVLPPRPELDGTGAPRIFARDRLEAGLSRVLAEKYGLRQTREHEFLVYNLVASALASERHGVQVPVVVSYNREYYRERFESGRAYLELRSDWMRYCTDALAANDLLFESPGEEGRRTRLVPSLRFRTLMHEHRSVIRPRPDEHGHIWLWARDVAAADEPRYYVQYEVTPEIQQQFDNLETINANNRKHEYSYTPWCPDAQRFELRTRLESCATEYDRIFAEGSFDRGGRFYASFLPLRRVERASLQIDGQEVVEIDYSAYHTSMCYALEGLCPGDQPYAIAGVSSKNRAAAKLAINIIYNVQPGQDPVRVLEHRLESSDIQLHGISAWELVARMRHAHRPIAHYFGSGVGTYLQYLDSCVAELVMLYFAYRGVACLGVHDSFIVPAQYEAQLRVQMKKAFQQVMGTNWSPRVSKK